MGFNGNEKQLRTGDVCLFSRKDLRGILNKCFMNTDWCHVGIVVLLDSKGEIIEPESNVNEKESNDSRSKEETGGNDSESKDEPEGNDSEPEGKEVPEVREIYILEMVSGKRYDIFLKTVVRGFGLSKFNMKKYNYAAFRRLKIHYPEIGKKIKDFHKKHVGRLFHDDVLSFIKLWLQTNVYRNNSHRRFCSQSASEFYRELSGLSYKDIFCIPDFEMKDELVTPEMFSSSKHSLLFDTEEIFYHEERQWPIGVIFFGLFCIVSLIFLIVLIFYLIKKMWYS